MMTRRAEIPPNPASSRPLGRAACHRPYCASPADDRSLLPGHRRCGVFAGTAFAAAPIIPAPVSDTPREGRLRRPHGDQRAGQRRQALASARYLADLLERGRGLKLAIRRPEAGERAIVLNRQGPAGEAYKLDVGVRRITISSGGDAGLFYGAVTPLAAGDGRDGRYEGRR